MVLLLTIGLAAAAVVAGALLITTGAAAATLFCRHGNRCMILNVSHIFPGIVIGWQVKTVTIAAVETEQNRNRMSSMRKNACLVAGRRHIYIMPIREKTHSDRLSEHSALR